MNVTATVQERNVLVQQLREESGETMMVVVRALNYTQWDYEKAKRMIQFNTTPSPEQIHKEEVNARFKALEDRISALEKSVTK